MRLGLFGINLGLFAIDPEVAVQLASVAEEAGWESVWTGEHFALPDAPVPGSPAPGSTPMLEPFVALANVAANTTSLRLGTGVTVLPLYNPYALAKQVVSLDRVSNGRLLFGVGVGYLESEFEGFGVDLSTRGAATDEMLESLHLIWTERTPTVRWRGREITGLRAEPRPIETTGPPLHVGGMSSPAMRRAIRQGDGWFGWALNPDEAGGALGQLAHLEQSCPRPGDRPKLEISICPPAGLPIDTRTAAAYRALGIDRLIVLPPTDLATDAAGMLTWIRELPGRLEQVG